MYLTEYPLPSGSIDLTVDNILGQEWVPEYEVREAALYNRYTWLQWLEELDYGDRIFSVALYRMHILLEAHISDASTKASERKQMLEAES